MDIYILDLMVIGLLLLTVTLGSGWIIRSPFSFALIYLLVGILLSPYGFGLIQIRPDAKFLERLTEFVVLISLFGCGLKMNRPFNLVAWGATVRLLGLLMPLSIFAVAALGHFALKLSWGEGILLGAILAPTDPVLASDIQLNHPEDRDGLRFGLTSEGGLNDALAFPFVYFGLHWLEDDNWQSWFGQWVLVDLLWAIAAGVGMGILVPRVVVWMDKRIRRIRPVNEAMEEFVALGIILLTYALTELAHGYGFLAVFVAGVATYYAYHDPEKRQVYLDFVEQGEKLAEIGTILLLGSLLRFEPMLRFAAPALLVAGLLIFVIRPVGTWISTIGAKYTPVKRLLFGWFGIRGVGSLYYLFYSLGGGLRGEVGELIAWVTLITVVISVVLHGMTATPFMDWYERYIETRQQRLKEALTKSDTLD
ncbi:sodium:proton antiporter [Phormidium tenue FACHB-886]|nr:sodium:proton antiporter [Phormidium tenue FACHB-886]